MNKVDSIVLRRKMGVCVPFTDDTGHINLGATTPRGVIGALVSNVTKLGFILQPDVIQALTNAPLPYLRDFHSWLVRDLRELAGVRTYAPMYPNFPTQVMEASDEELYLNAILHYFGDVFGLRILPVYDKQARPALPPVDVSRLKPIRLIGEGERDWLLNEILLQRTSPSQADKEDILALLAAGQCLDAKLDVPNREMVAVFLGAIKDDREAVQRYAKLLVKTSTDVMRVAVSMSGGDVSLSEDSNFVAFGRADRKFLLYLLNRLPVAQAAEDMMRFREKWKRLGERLHPGDYKDKFGAAFDMFTRIRNEGQQTFYSRVEESLSTHEWQAALRLLSSRPGEFARSLSRVLRLCGAEEHLVNTAPETDFVLLEFERVAPKIASNVLWQVFAHFRGHQHLEHKDRVFFPKGSTTKPLVGTNHLPHLGDELQHEVCRIAWSALKARYAELPPLGGMYIDPVCKGLVVPTGTRSASTQLRAVGRGSRFALDDGEVVRLFMWWRDQNGGRVDLDLSAVMFNADWVPMGQVSWTNLRAFGGKDSFDALHSGDITSAPNGACEFLDLNMDRLAKRGAAYIVMSVFSFTGQPFNTLTDSFAGFMVRDGLGTAGEIFEAATVQTRFSLMSPSTAVCPLILDVVNRRVVWADLSIKKDARHSSVESSWKNITLAGRAIYDYADTRPTLYDVFRLHRQARGEKVRRSDADFVVADDGDMSPYDTAKFMSEWL